MCSYSPFHQFSQNFVKISYVGITIYIIRVPQLIKVCNYDHFRQLRQNFCQNEFCWKDHFYNWVKAKGPFLQLN